MSCVKCGNSASEYHELNGHYVCRGCYGQKRPSDWATEYAQPLTSLSTPCGRCRSTNWIPVGHGNHKCQSCGYFGRVGGAPRESGATKQKERKSSSGCKTCDNAPGTDEFCLHCGTLRDKETLISFAVAVAICLGIAAWGFFGISNATFGGFVTWTAGLLGTGLFLKSATAFVSSLRRSHWYRTCPEAKELTKGKTGRICYRCHEEIQDDEFQCPLCGAVEWEVTTAWMLLGWLVVFGGCLAFRNIEIAFVRYVVGVVGLGIGGFVLLIPTTEIAAAWKKNLLFASSRPSGAAPATTQPRSRQELRGAALAALQQNDHDKAAAGFLRAVEEDPHDATSVTHCGVALWLGLKDYLKLVGPGTIQSCTSGAADELVLTYLLEPRQFPGGVFARQVRQAVPAEDLKMVINVARAAELCFRQGYHRGDKGGGLLWLVALLRGTGRYQQCRLSVKQAARDPGMPDKEMKECREWIDGIAGYEADFRWLEGTAEGWVVPRRDRLLRGALTEVVPTAMRAFHVLKSPVESAPAQSDQATTERASDTDADIPDEDELDLLRWLLGTAPDEMNWIFAGIVVLGAGTILLLPMSVIAPAPMHWAWGAVTALAASWFFLTLTRLGIHYSNPQTALGRCRRRNPKKKKIISFVERYWDAKSNLCFQTGAACLVASAVLLGHFLPWPYTSAFGQGMRITYSLLLATLGAGVFTFVLEAVLTSRVYRMAALLRDSADEKQQAAGEAWFEQRRNEDEELEREMEREEQASMRDKHTATVLTTALIACQQKDLGLLGRTLREPIQCHACDEVFQMEDGCENCPGRRVMVVKCPVCRAEIFEGVPL